jgi:hypothetical protein
MAGVGALDLGWTEGWRRWEWIKPFTEPASLVSCRRRRKKRSWMPCRVSSLLSWKKILSLISAKRLWNDGQKLRMLSPK